MEKLTYTRFQRDMEISLFRVQQYLQICATDGEDAAESLVNPDGAPQGGYAPDQIQIEHLPIYEAINILEAYAYERDWHENLSNYCSKLKLFIRSIAHPEVISEWKLEAEEHADEIEFSDGESIYFHAYGNYYAGIIEDIYQRATARLKLDEEDHLTLRDIAYLAELNERSVMNAVHAKGAGRLQTDGKDQAGRALVDPAIAMEWLDSKDRFGATRGVSQAIKDEASADLGDEEDWVFVPEARDGSRFLPDLRTQSGFRIGSKGNEKTVSEYRDALSELVNMKNPCWRRKNQAGNAGIVTGIQWAKIPSAQLLNEDSDGIGH